MVSCQGELSEEQKCLMPSLEYLPYEKCCYSSHLQTYHSGTGNPVLLGNAHQNNRKINPESMRMTEEQEHRQQ